MKVFMQEFGGKKIHLVCDSRNTRNGFAHDCSLFVDDREVRNDSLHYLNRTWESWTFQSVITTTLENAAEFAESTLKNRFKDSRGYRRMTPARAEEFAEWVSLDDMPLKRELALYREAKASFADDRRR